ncbi:MAG: carbamoyltransferase C-terminal domain-containing protein [archaeon]
MIVLGITDGHDSGAAVIKDGKILAAVNEERLAREKLFFGTPRKSIAKVLDLAGIGPGQVDKVAIAARLGYMASMGWTNLSLKKKVYQFLCNRAGFWASTNSFANLQRAVFSRTRSQETAEYTRSLGVDAPVEYVDHHLCHAASAYYTSGKDECLVLTSDGSGDANSSTVYLGRDNDLKCIKQVPTFHSIAYYYAYVTLLAGFKMFRHEGKITGLAAYGDASVCYDTFRRAFAYKNGQPTNTIGLMGQGAIDYLKKNLAGVDPKHYSAAVQQRLEEVMSKFAADYAGKTKIPDLAAAGGIFANVKLNQKILETKGIRSVYIHPHMGDGGIGVGAALQVSAQNMLDRGSGLKPYQLDNVYFGPGFTNAEVEASIENNGLTGEHIANIEKYTAEKIADKKVVGHFGGRMEYGPRALGNRSILADPTDTTINDWLNQRLKRTEFMPFAPSILDRAAPEYYEGYERGQYPARFMTITFDDKKEAQKAKAVVHVDNTTRPQVVSAKQNPRYYKILKHYEQETGLPIFVNTSFNIHEEPIVCSPDDALRSFKKGTCDVLVMGNWVVSND